MTKIQTAKLTLNRAELVRIACALDWYADGDGASYYSIAERAVTRRLATKIRKEIEALDSKS